MYAFTDKFLPLVRSKNEAGFYDSLVLKIGVGEGMR